MFCRHGRCSLVEFQKAANLHCVFDHTWLMLLFSVISQVLDGMIYVLVGDRTCMIWTILYLFITLNWSIYIAWRFSHGVTFMCWLWYIVVCLCIMYLIEVSQGAMLRMLSLLYTRGKSWRGLKSSVGCTTMVYARCGETHTECIGWSSLVILMSVTTPGREMQCSRVSGVIAGRDVNSRSLTTSPSSGGGSLRGSSPGAI
jgi:hypothetical protein